MLYEISYWFLLYSYFEEFYGDKRGRNYVSFTHSVLFIESVYNKKEVVELSVAYFIYDLLLSNFKRDFVYVIHHIASLYLLYDFKNNEAIYIIDLIYYGEVSNFFNYIVYDLIKQNSDTDVLKLMKHIQAVWYTTIRVCLPYIAYDKLHIIHTYQSIYIMYLLYIMGLMWSVYMIKSCKILN